MFSATKNRYPLGQTDPRQTLVPSVRKTTRLLQHRNQFWICADLLFNGDSMQHYLFRRGYISLYIVLFICIAVGIIFINFLLNAIGMPLPGNVLIGIKGLVLFIIPIVCTRRFLLIEKRAPTTWETYFMSLITFLPVFFLMLVKTVITIGGASQNKAIDMESFAVQSMLNLVILSGICLIMMLLSYGTLAKIWNRNRVFA